MDFEKNPELPGEENWLDEILDPPELSQEIGPDEQAVDAAGLTRPEDLELEMIMEEANAWSQEPVPAPMEESPAEELDGDFEEPEQENAALWAAMLEAMPDMEDEELFEDEAPADVIQEEPAVLEEIAPEPEQAVSAVFDETRRYDVAPEWTVPQEAQLQQEPEQEEPDQAPAPKKERKKKTKKEKNTERSVERKTEGRKMRPRPKKDYGLFGLPHLVASIIWIAIIVGIGVSLGRTLWLCAAEVLAFGKPDMSVTITITEADMEAEDTMERVAAKLKNAGLIAYPDLFVMYADLTDAKEEIAAGTYTLKGTDDYMALVNSMNTYSGSRETVEVMIPEGYTCAQIFQLLEEKGVCTAEKLGEYAATGNLGDYWFLEGVERGSKYCLEGYLFPDTYEFYVGDDPGRVIEKMLGDSVGGFNVRFTDIMEEKLVELNDRLAKMMKKNGYDQSYIDEHKVTVREVVIIASMIEKETTGRDRYDISSVIYNRLTNAKEHPYLNIDATIIYALGGKIDPLTGETIPLTEADMKIDSPYNTYLYKGLPPGPISNPGVYSLLAALDPNETKYHYYVYNPAIGAHKFSETYKQHQDYINSMG